MSEPDKSTESRSARIERYAGNVANLTRTLLTRGFGAVDQVTAWWTTAKTKVKSMKPTPKGAPAA